MSPTVQALVQPKVGPRKLQISATFCNYVAEGALAVDVRGEQTDLQVLCDVLVVGEGDSAVLVLARFVDAVLSGREVRVDAEDGDVCCVGACDVTAGKDVVALRLQRPETFVCIFGQVVVLRRERDVLESSLGAMGGEGRFRDKIVLVDDDYGSL